MLPVLDRVVTVLGGIIFTKRCTRNHQQSNWNISVQSGPEKWPRHWQTWFFGWFLIQRKYIGVYSFNPEAGQALTSPGLTLTRPSRQKPKNWTKHEHRSLRSWRISLWTLFWHIIKITFNLLRHINWDCSACKILSVNFKLGEEYLLLTGVQ